MSGVVLPPFSGLNNLSGGAVRIKVLHPFKTEKLMNISVLSYMWTSNLLPATNSNSGSHK